MSHSCSSWDRVSTTSAGDRPRVRFVLYCEKSFVRSTVHAQSEREGRDGKTHNLPEDRREDLVQLQRQDERRELRRPSIQRLDKVGRLASGLPVLIIALVRELYVEAVKGEAMVSQRWQKGLNSKRDVLFLSQEERSSQET